MFFADKFFGPCGQLDLYQAQHKTGAFHDTDLDDPCRIFGVDSIGASSLGAGIPPQTNGNFDHMYRKYGLGRGSRSLRRPRTSDV